MRAGLAAKQATGSRLKIPYYQGLMAGLLGRAGRGCEGARAAGGGVGQIEVTGERWFEAELHRLRGDLLLQSIRASSARGRPASPPPPRSPGSKQAAWWEARVATLAGRAARAA